MWLGLCCEFRWLPQTVLFPSSFQTAPFPTAQRTFRSPGSPPAPLTTRETD